MNENNEKKCCQYERNDEKPCPHNDFDTYTDSKTSDKIDRCIFHTPMKFKNQNHIFKYFWDEFDGYFVKTRTEYIKAKTEAEREKIELDCEGFIFPDTGDRFLSRDFPFISKFTTAIFAGTTYFKLVTFKGKTDFTNTIFEGDVHFWRTTFDQNTDFRWTIFERNANFAWAIFAGNITYYRTKFECEISFKSVAVSKSLRFPETQFCQDADFRDIETNSKNKNGTLKNQGEVRFNNAYFHSPERVQIGGKTIKLGQWSFKDTNIENINFIDEDWKRKGQWKGNYREAPFKRKFWPFKFYGRKVIYDEILANEDKNKPHNKRRVTWEDAGQVYRRLRKKFEGELAYELTSDFHYGQMECRRLNSDRVFIHPDRVFAFFYKIVSGYGERVGLPLLWFTVFLGIFTWLFLITGFPAPDGSPIVWVASFNDMFSYDWWCQVWQGISFTLRASISFAVPSYAEGIDAKVGATLPALMFFWKLLAVTFGTFFVLALRRRFKK